MDGRSLSWFGKGTSIKKYLICLVQEFKIGTIWFPAYPEIDGTFLINIHHI
jgi:hypothetical protein